MEEEKKPRKKKRGRNALIVLGVLVVVGLILHWPTESGFTISRETTYVTGPLNPDGTINYVAALNERLSKGVTPENNAAPLLIQALGPDVFTPRVRQTALQRLGIGELPVDGDYFTELSEYEGDDPDAFPRPEYGTPELQAQRDLLDKLIKTPWSPEQHPRIAAWLKANEKPLSVVVEAADRPRCYVPLISPSSPPMLIDCNPSYVSSRLLPPGGALAARSMLRLHAGDVQGSLADILAAHRLARLTAQGPTLIGGLCAAAAETMACEADLVLVASGKLTASQAKAQLRALDALGPMPDISVAYDYWERVTALDCAMMLYRSPDPAHALKSVGEVARSAGKGPTADLDWDCMLRTINHWYDRMAEAHKRPTDRQRREALNAVHDDFKSMLADQKRFAAIKGFLARAGGQCTKPWLTQMVTNVLLTILMPVVTNAVSNQQIVTMRLELVKVSLALAAFKAEKGEYPQKLSELSPAYVKKVPADVFAEGPLVYKRAGKGYLLYSVGRNMIDDGGVEDEDAGKDDIVVRVE